MIQPGSAFAVNINADGDLEVVGTGANFIQDYPAEGVIQNTGIRHYDGREIMRVGWDFEGQNFYQSGTSGANRIYAPLDGVGVKEIIRQEGYVLNDTGLKYTLHGGDASQGLPYAWMDGSGVVRIFSGDSDYYGSSPFPYNEGIMWLYYTLT